MEENNFVNEPSEVYKIEREQVGDDDKVVENIINPTLIDVDTVTLSISVLIDNMKQGIIEMDTDSYFQRHTNLWDKVRQSHWIESILVRLPLPTLFFDTTNDNNWLVVDGLQRLSSIRNFCIDKTLKLTNLEFLHHLDGMGWDDIGEDLQRVIEETQVIIHKIMPGTPTDVKFNIFKRINTGGLKLHPQEIRHALFQGKSAEFLAELAQSEKFISATNGKISPRRMEDRDFVNRFLCFYLFGYKDYHSIDTHMSKAMASISGKSDNELYTIRKDFEKAMILAEEIFEEEAFRKIHDEYYNLPPINKALFDALSVQFALLNDDEIQKLRKNKIQFKETLKERLSSDALFFTSISSATGDRRRVHYRHQTIADLIQDTIS